MVKRYLTIVLSALCFLGIQAQTLNVKSFAIKANDITARTQPRQDINGNDCALVKVRLAAGNASFNGNVIGDVAYDKSEYYVYMPHGSKRLTIKLEGYLPLDVSFSEFGINSLEGRTVYVLTLSGVTGTQQLEAPITKTGWIIIDSEPSGASVYINDEFVGNTPLTNYKQSYGTYQYRLEIFNYHPETGIIELNAGRFEQKVVLKPAFGSISVKSSIAGAKIVLDGKQTGKQTPATLTEIPSGTHTISLQMDKYAPKQQEVIVEDGLTAKISMELDARFAKITINSLDGADIYSNGKLLGRNRISEDMMEGYYDLEARLNHHKSVTKQIQVVAGQSQDITLNPIPKYGSLDIVSTPHDASVTIDGKSYGKTPLTVEQLLEGEHHVALFLEGYTKENRYVCVNEKESASIEVLLSKERPAAETMAKSNTISKDISEVVNYLNRASNEKEVNDKSIYIKKAFEILNNLSKKDPAHKILYNDIQDKLGAPISYSKSEKAKGHYMILIKRLEAINKSELFQHVETKQPSQCDVDPAIYETMVERVRTGAYRIEGTDRVVKVKEGDNLQKISRRFLGPDMEHYLVVYNGLKESSSLKVGQEIKIPKLKLRRTTVIM